MTAGFSPVAVGAFELFFRPWMRARIDGVHIAGPPASLPRDVPLLLAANHCSWWDGFLLRALQRTLRPGAPLFSLMTERELARFPFLRSLGAVGMDPTSPVSIAHAARTLEARVREDPSAVVSFFPQGRIWPSHRRPLGFARGVELFATRLGAVVLPVGIHLEAMNRVSPSAFLSCGEPVHAPVRADALEHAVESELDAILAHLSTHGEEAVRRWPPVGARLDPGGDLQVARRGSA